MRKRTGGKGIKGKTLKQEFNYYLRQYNRRILEEQALIEADSGIVLSSKPDSVFTHLDYNEIMEQGLTRNEKGKTIYYKGEDAIRIQIQSLKARASKSAQTEQFIRNYGEAMLKNGYSSTAVTKVLNAMNSMAMSKLAILIHRDILPSIQFMYVEEFDEDELVEEILNSLKHGISKEEYKELLAKAKKERELIKKRWELLK